MRFLRLKKVIEITGLSRSSIYKNITEGQFPRSVSLGGRSVAWLDSEVEKWVMERVEARDGE